MTKSRFRVQPPGGAPYEIAAEGQTVLIGREPRCAIRFSEEYAGVVSRTHARLEFNSSEAYLEDLNSTNGVFINGRRVSARQRISVGQQFTLGYPGPEIELLSLVPVGVATQNAPAVSPPSSSPSVAPRHETTRNGAVRSRRHILLASVIASLSLCILAMVYFVVSSGQLGASAVPVPSPVPSPPDPTPLPTPIPIPDPVPEPSPPPDIKASAVAFIGEVEGIKLPWCSGWICGQRQIATSAPMASVLQEVIDAGGSVLVFLNSGTLMKVEKFRFHPSYSADGGGSLAAAVAIAQTADELPAAATVKHSDELSQPLVGSKVEVVSFDIPQHDAPAEGGRFSPKPYNKLEPPRLARTAGTVAAIRSFTGAPRDLPLLKVDLMPKPGCDGGAVVDQTGAVIGTLLSIKSDASYYVVLVDHLDDLKE